MADLDWDYERSRCWSQPEKPTPEVTTAPLSPAEEAELEALLDVVYLPTFTARERDVARQTALIAAGYFRAEFTLERQQHQQAIARHRTTELELNALVAGLQAELALVKGSEA